MEVTGVGSRALDVLLSRLRDGLIATAAEVLSFIDPRLTGRLRGAFALNPLVAIVGEDGSVTWSEGDRTIYPSARFLKLTDRRLVALRLDDAQVLRRMIHLPAAAARQLDSVLRLNIGSWTPFSADEVFAAAKVVGPAAGRGLVSVEICCAPKKAVQRKISDLGVQPDSVYLGGNDYESKINTPKRRRLSRVRMILLALAGVAFLQSVVLVALVMAREDRAISALENRRAALTRTARQQAAAAKRQEKQQAERTALSHKLSETESLTSRLRALAGALRGRAMVREFVFSRERGVGHMVLVAPREFDVTTALQATKQFWVRNLTISGGGEAGGQTYAVEFVIQLQHGQAPQ